MSTSVHLFFWPVFCSRFWPFILGSFQLKHEKCQGNTNKESHNCFFKFIRGTIGKFFSWLADGPRCSLAKYSLCHFKYNFVFPHKISVYCFGAKI